MRQEERHARAVIAEHEKIKLTAKFPVVTLLRFLQHRKVRVQLVFLIKSGRVDPGQHLVLFGTAPVGTGNVQKLKGLAYALGAHEMRAGAEVGKIALLIEADRFAFRQVFDEFHLVGFFLFLHQGDRFRARQFKTLDGPVFLDDLLHFLFDLRKVVLGDGRFKIDIIIEAVRDRRADGKLRRGIQPLDGLGHDMGSAVAERGKTAFFVFGCQDLQAAVLIEHSPKVHDLPVHLSGAGDTRQPFGKILRDLNDAFCFLVTLYRAVF